MSTDTVRLWTTEELARFLGVPISTVHKWRHEGTAPPAYRVGKGLRFRPEDVEKWLETRASA